MHEVQKLVPSFLRICSWTYWHDVTLFLMKPFTLYTTLKYKKCYDKLISKETCIALSKSYFIRSSKSKGENLKSQIEQVQSKDPSK